MREDDYAGLRIRGATNLPAGDWDEGTPQARCRSWQSPLGCAQAAQPSAALQRLLSGLPEGTERVVLHCALSQVRGPKCAQRLQAHLDKQKQATPQVQVLQTGFEGFRAVRLVSGSLLSLTELG